MSVIVSTDKAGRARPALAAIAVALLLSGCAGLPNPFKSKSLPPPAAPKVEAPPQVTPAMAAAQETLIRMAAMQERLYRVAAPLLIQNADLCKQHARNLLGFTAKNKYSYTAEYADAAQAGLGMGERLQVTGVLPGSGAARAGLRSGDVLVAANGKALSTGPNAEVPAGALFGSLVASHAAIKLSVERDGDKMEIAIPVTHACGFRVDLGNADNVNSYADGQRVLVTRGMMALAQNDEDLAYVLAKGIAHNVLNHAAITRSTGTEASMIENLASMRPDTSLLIGSGGIKPMPAELDAQADTLALYLLVRANYQIDGVSRFWQSLAGMHPAQVLNGYVANHPDTKIRLAAIERTATEIRAKQLARKPIVP